MRHGSSNNRRTRNRNNNHNNNHNNGGRKVPNKNKVFDSSGPEVRIRGTAHQINEKYMILAKDASSSGDHVLAQSYMQYAEHYQRLINEWAEQAAPVVAPVTEDVVTEGNDVNEDVVAQVTTTEDTKVLEDA